MEIFLKGNTIDIPIKEYVSALVGGMIAQAESLRELEHKSEKGIFRELFLTDLINHFLTSQFSACSGIVINKHGEESTQEDIIIYDNRILPPFIYEQNIRIIPPEPVLAIIEVKSMINHTTLINLEKTAGKLRKLYRELEDEYRKTKEDFKLIPPITCLFAFQSDGLSYLEKVPEGRAWLDDHITNLKAICLAKRYSWINMEEGGWKIGKGDSIHYEETKRFIAVLLDNCRTISEKRWDSYRTMHQDWLSKYIRNI